MLTFQKLIIFDKFLKQNEPAVGLGFQFQALYSKGFPKEEKFGLTSQVRRAAASVPTNIAEGAARTGTGEFLQSLSVASGSLAEVETFLLIAFRLRLLSETAYKDLMREAGEIGRMLTGLKRSLHSGIVAFEKRQKAKKPIAIYDHFSIDDGTHSVAP